MKLYKYKEFMNLKPINENLDKAKKFLKDRVILFNVAQKLGFIDDDIKFKMKEGEIKTLRLEDFTPDQQGEIKREMRKARLSEIEVKSLEKDPEFVRLRELLEQNLGYLYMFTYMYYVERVEFEEIERLYKEVLEHKDLLTQLKDIPEVGKKFDINFIDVTIPNKEETRSNAEILADGLAKLGEHRSLKRVINSLTNVLRKAYNEASDMDREGLQEIAVGFDSIPDKMVKDGSGKMISKKERTWKNFFGEMVIDQHRTLPDGSTNPKFGKPVWRSKIKECESYDNPIRELVRRAKNFLKAADSSGYMDRIEKIETCNDKFGIMGCVKVFDQGGIVIVQVNSHAANQYLNGHTTHCIVNSSSYWDQYLGEHNKQYYLYNTNVATTDRMSTVGVTIRPDKTWSSHACNNTQNVYIGSSFKNLLKEWEKQYGIDDGLFDYLTPMSKKEIERRERSKKAEREIVRKGISMDQIEKYVKEDGADINKDSARVLINAVEENDHEKTKLCLELGASPNLAKGSEAPISKAKGIEMIKLLIEYGSNMTGDVFQNVVGDNESLEYCLKAGLDPNFDRSRPFRVVAHGSWKSKEDVGEGYFDAFKLLMKYGARTYDSRTNKNTLLQWLCERFRIEMLEYLKSIGKTFTDNEWKDAHTWIEASSRLTDENKKIMTDYIIDNMKNPSILGNHKRGEEVK